MSGLVFFKLFGIDGVIIGMTLSFFPYTLGVIKEFKENKINFKSLKEKFNFIGVSYAQTLFGALYSSLDKILIAPLLGYVLLGNYSLGLQFLTILMIMPEILRKYLLPYDATGYQNKKLRKFAILFSVGITLFGFFIGPQIISVFFPKFESAQDILKVLSLNVFPNTIMLSYWTKFLGQERKKRYLLLPVQKLVYL